VPDRTEENHQIPTYEITSFWTEISNRKAPRYIAKVFQHSTTLFSCTNNKQKYPLFFWGIVVVFASTWNLKEVIMHKSRNESLLMTNRNGGEAISQYIHMMLEAVDTIELSKTRVNFISYGVI